MYSLNASGKNHRHAVAKTASTDNRNRPTRKLALSCERTRAEMLTTRVGFWRLAARSIGSHLSGGESLMLEDRTTIHKRRKIVVIGNGMAGARVVEEILARDAEHAEI